MSIPRVWPEYTTKRVMVSTTACKECSLLGCVFTTLGAVFHQVMDFCEGFAIKNLEMLDERKVDREALLQRVTRRRMIESFRLWSHAAETAR